MEEKIKFMGGIMMGDVGVVGADAVEMLIFFSPSLPFRALLFGADALGEKILKKD